MPEWVLRYKDKSIICTDITEANKLMKEEQPEEFYIVIGNSCFGVILTTGQIWVNGNVICCDSIPKSKFRFINFQRVKITYSGKEIVDKSVEYFLGWQTTYKGKNIQRMINIKPDLTYEIIGKG